MSVISERIQLQMKRQQLSYGTLSDLTGIPKAMLQRYATGITENIPINRITAIAEALRVTPSCLLG